MTDTTRGRELTPAVGELVAGKYRVVGVLGQGGMGVVLDAVHEQLRTSVAIKLLHASIDADPIIIARFLREARAAAGLQSDHVVRVFDVGTLESGAPYMVLERLHGEDLGQLLEREGPQTVDSAVDYLLQACEGLAEAHAMGIVHRDLKPSNLFRVMRKDGSRVVKILDFGISKEMQPADGSLTATSQAIGSPYYMSPEQVRSSKDVDRRTDIWALGVILHELLTRSTPFPGDTLGSVYAAIISDPPSSLRSVRTEVPAALDAAVQRCLEKSVARRYASVDDLAKDLAPFSRRGAEAVARIAELSLQEHRRQQGLASTAAPSVGHDLSNAMTEGVGAGALAPLSAVSAMIASPDTGRTDGAKTGAAWGGTRPAATDPARTSRRPVLIGAVVAAIGLVAATTFLFVGQETKHDSSTPTLAPAAPLPAPPVASDSPAPPAASTTPTPPPPAVAEPAAAPSTAAVASSAPPSSAASATQGAIHGKAPSGASPRKPATTKPTSAPNEAYDDRK